VRLYETGVGYFERSGVLSPSQRTGLPVPASHLDDALQSLVVFTPGHGDPVHGVAFSSNVGRGMARAMAGLPAGGNGPISYRDLLLSLKGAHVEAKTRAGTYEGRLVDLESPKEADQDTQPDPTAIVVLTDAAELVVLPMNDLRSVRPTDPTYGTRLDAALDALSVRSAQNRKMLDVLGASRGPVMLGYVAETPVWRTTYRLVLDDDGRRGALQGWALLHNDTDEDWNNVKVELVNGRPDSFLYPLAAPRYARRELVHPDDDLSTVPQLLHKTADAAWGDNVEDDDESSGGLGLTGVGEGGGGRGEGIGLGAVGSVGHAVLRSGETGVSSVLAIGNLAHVSQAAGIEAGALFIYTLPERLALRAHASALAPFLQQPVDVAAITWVDMADLPPRSGVRFVNSTAQTLPAGTITCFASGGFAGESALDRLKPGERRFVRFGVDLDVSADVFAAKGRPPVEAFERLTYREGTLFEHFRRTTYTVYSLGNGGAHARAVYISLHVGANATVTGADAVDFDSAAGSALAVVNVAPKARIEREVVATEGLTSSWAVENLWPENLAEVVASPSLAPADKTIAVDLLAKQGQLDETKHAKERATGELAAIEKELERLREDAKAVGGDGEHTAAAPRELVTRLLAAEDRHAAARKQLDELTAQEKTRFDAVKATLSHLGPS
jgi:hypothetical protein